MEADELLARARLARRALSSGDVETAFTIVVALEHALAYGLDSLALLLDNQDAGYSPDAAETGVQTAECALAEVVVVSRGAKLSAARPPRFTFVATGAVEGKTSVELYTLGGSLAERDRVIAWLAGGDAELRDAVGGVLHRFAPR